MKVKSIICIFLLLAFTGYNTGVLAAGSTDDATIIGGGARPLGMGKAFVAIADDADAIFINPSGIAGIKSPQAMSMFTNLLNEVYYMEFSGAVPAPMGALGVGYIATGTNGILIGSPEVSTNYYDTLLAFSYSSPLARFTQYGRNIFLGTDIKLYSRGYSGGINQQATGISADIGLKFIYNPYLSFGICRQNIMPVALGGKIQWHPSGAEENLAGIDKVGIAIKPINFDKKVTLAYDVDLPAYGTRPVTMHFGGEWQMHEALCLRGGLDQNLDSSTQTKVSWNPTFGLSLEIKNFRLDYAYHGYYNDPSLATNYISISLRGEQGDILRGRQALLIDQENSVL